MFLSGVVAVYYKNSLLEQLKVIKQIANPIPEYTGYSCEKKSSSEQHSENNYDVVFIGDSNTYGAEWQVLFPSLRIANRGINGDRTDGVIKRLESIYSTSASKAFIMIGINDFYYGMSGNEVFDNYKYIVSKLVDHGMEVYIQSTVLAGKRLAHIRVQNVGLNKRIMELNERLQVLAKQTDSVTYIDLNVGLAPDSLLKPWYTWDDIHLNEDGYAIWKELIKSYLQ
jgi:lysophospholipase L1-like esterase